MAAVDGDLLERLDQLSGALEIGDQLVCGVAATVGEFLEHGTAHRTRGDLLGEVAQRCASVEATVRLVPTGVLISCETPATRPPSAASRSVSIR